MVRIVRRARVRRVFALDALEVVGFGAISAAGFTVNFALGLLVAGGAMVYLANTLAVGGDDAQRP